MARVNARRHGDEKRDWEMAANYLDGQARQRAALVAPIKREQPTTSAARIAASFRCSRASGTFSALLGRIVKGPGPLGNQVVRRCGEQQASGSAKIDPLIAAFNALMATNPARASVLRECQRVLDHDLRACQHPHLAGSLVPIVGRSGDTT